MSGQKMVNADEYCSGDTVLVLGNGCSKFDGIDAFAALSVHCSNHIVIGHAALNGVVCIGESLDGRGINFAIIAFGLRFAVHVVARHVRRTGIPSERHGVRFASGWAR